MTDFPDFIARLPELDLPIEGASGHLLQGAEHQVAFIVFDRDVDVPDHSHRAQWELVIAGQVTLRMDGAERTLGPGEVFFIPEGKVHGANVSVGYRSVVFFDQADRYSAKAGGG